MLQQEEVKELVEMLGKEGFGPDDHHPIKKNCNHFCEELGKVRLRIMD